MNRETAQACLRDCLDWTDSESGMSFKFTAEDWQGSDLQRATVNADIVAGEEKVGSLIWTLAAEEGVLDLSMVRIDEEWTGKGFGERALKYVEATAKKAGVKQMVAGAVTTDAAAKTLSGGGWAKRKGKDADPDMGKKHG